MSTNIDSVDDLLTLGLIILSPIVATLVVWRWWEGTVGRFDAEPFLPAVPLKILVSPLLGDTENRQTGHVLDALRTHLNAGERQGNCVFRVLTKPVHPKSFVTGSTRGRRIATHIQKLLTAYGADLMIWGHVLQDDQSLQLSITTNESGNHYSNRSYALADPSPKLQDEFAGALGAAIAAWAINTADAIAHQPAKLAAPEARNIAAATAPLIDNALPAMTPRQRGDLREASARMHTRLGRQLDENETLRVAVDGFRKAAEDYCAAKLFDRWSTTQNNLGLALQSLGTRETGTVRLEEATMAFRNAMKRRTRDQAPLNWARTQTNLGNALVALGNRESGTERLEEAVAAYRDALKERTRKRVPQEWAETLYDLGCALAILGERETGIERLEDALAAFRNSLKEYTRGRDPLNWAMTQHNIGTTLWTIGQRESGTKRFEEAIAAYRKALEQRTRDRAPLDWAATLNSLGNALATLGEREGRSEFLDEAIAKYREAITEWTRDRMPVEWAIARSNTGEVHIIYFEMIGEAEHLDIAERHAEVALEVFRESAGDYYFGDTEELLARIANHRSP